MSARTTLLDQMEIKQEPRTLLGSYFLAAETEGLAKGVYFQLASFEDLAAVYQRYEPTWNNLAPVFDCRYSTIPKDTAACIIGYDNQGEPAVAHAVRLFDLTGTTIKRSFEDLSFWYGAEAAKYRDAQCSITAPTSETMTGRIMYTGAYWVRPDLRRIGFGQAIQEIGRFFGYSQWDFDYEISVGAMAFLKPEIQQRYGFEGHEESFEIAKGDKTLLRGVFLWAHRDKHLDRLRGVVAAAEQEYRSGGGRNADEQEFPTVAHQR